jgi:hypothetical protein
MSLLSWRTHALDSNITDWISDQGSLVMTKSEDVSTSNSDIDTNSSEHCDGEPRQFEQIDDENEFKDIELENLVMTE